MPWHRIRTLTLPSFAVPHLRLPKGFDALAVRDYRLFLGSQVIANTGLWMQRIAQDWLILQLTGSAAAVGLTVALQFGPVLLFGLFGGALADKFDRRKLLMLTQSAAATVALLLGVLAISGSIQAWHIWLMAFVTGLITVVDNPARQVFVTELVGPKLIRNAVSLNSMVFQTSGLVGPALAGVLIGLVGEGPSFIVNGVATALVVFALAAIRTRSERSEATNLVPTRSELAAGLSAIANRPRLLWPIIAVGAMGLVAFNGGVLYAAFAEREFEMGVGGYSLFTAAAAIGAVVGAVVCARVQISMRLRTLVSMVALSGVLFTLTALTPTPWLMAIVLVVYGASTMLFLITANSTVQITCPPHLRGRVMSVYIMVLFGGQALGNPLAGAMTDHLGVRLTSLLCGLFAITTALAVGAVLARRGDLKLQVNRTVRRPVEIVRAHAH
ncbi:MFS transporter [Parenemella sanctibonifatiensis]|uniref:MFS transporter n=1 Tax=Parenemella sanctibonifatiensis TaxID=2016505 RepID=A0A255E0Y4_9ACTN|nr:MFS transporter [Parenemella sanctibonifatiensis]OYN85227.1 MFS transporter [Parenemella sanctibonifatiensis]